MPGPKNALLSSPGPLPGPRTSDLHPPLSRPSVPLFVDSAGHCREKAPSHGGPSTTSLLGHSEPFTLDGAIELRRRYNRSNTLSLPLPGPLYLFRLSRSINLELRSSSSEESPGGGVSGVRFRGSPIARIAPPRLAQEGLRSLEPQFRSRNRSLSPLQGIYFVQHCFCQQVAAANP